MPTYYKPIAMGPLSYNKQLRRDVDKRRVAARTLQRAFRSRKNRASAKKLIKNTIISQNQNQYHLFGEPGVLITSSPIVVCQLSALPYDHDNPNAKWSRTSPKVKLQSWNMEFEVSAASDQQKTKVVLQLVRHKRNAMLQTADLRSTVTATAPAVDADNTPFLACANAPNALGISELENNPFILAKMSNPKVMEVVRTWHFTLQSQEQTRNAAIPTANVDVLASQFFPVTYPKFKRAEHFHKVDKILKYPVSDSSVLSIPYPGTYNNSNYSIIAYSNYAAGGSNPPFLNYGIRTSFRDID